MPGNDDLFSLTRFEQLTYARRREEAMLELMKLLHLLVVNGGELVATENAASPRCVIQARDVRLATRVAAAITALFGDPEFNLSHVGFERLIRVQQWFSVIFGASAFGTADHVIEALGKAGNGAPGQVALEDRDLTKVCLLYSPDSALALQPDLMWAKDKRLAASLFLALLSSRLLLTEAANEMRETLLGWLAPKLLQLSVDELPAEILHQAWMHCSYGFRTDKHAVKRSINELVRNKMLSMGAGDLPNAPPIRGKPVLVCVLEQFVTNHSVYRTHSLALESLKGAFRVVGVGPRGAVDEVSTAVFDEVHTVPVGEMLWDFVKRLHSVVADLRPDLVYYPSIGMSPHAIFLANVRLAPIQTAGLGHPATTLMSCIDYVLVEDDYLGEPARFSERIVTVPAAAMPYRRRTDESLGRRRTRSSRDQVHIAIPATVMKINAPLLAALRRIAEGVKTSVRFHFLSGVARGLGAAYLQNVVERFLPGRVEVHPQSSFEIYLDTLNDCDIFLSPFPFGGTNSIVDATRQGLPGVCMTGPEVHARMDEGLFRRLGLPEWLTARNEEDYVRAALRLINHPKERKELRDRLGQRTVDAVLFNGKPELFSRTMEWILATHSQHAAMPGGTVLRPPVNAAKRSSKRPAAT